MVSDMHHQHNSLPRKNSDNLNKPDEITEYNIATRRSASPAQMSARRFSPSMSPSSISSASLSSSSSIYSRISTASPVQPSASTSAQLPSSNTFQPRQSFETLHAYEESSRSPIRARGQDETRLQKPHRHDDTDTIYTGRYYPPPTPLSPPRYYAASTTSQSYAQRSLYIADYDPPLSAYPEDDDLPEEDQQQSSYDDSAASPVVPVFPPTPEAERQARATMESCHKQPKIIYASDVSYQKPDATLRIPLILTKRNKNAHFVLTTTHLLQFKSAAKARAAGADAFATQPVHNLHNDKDRVLLALSDVYGVHRVISPPNSFRIEHLHPETKQPLALVVTAESAYECDQWLRTLREAVRVHHPAIKTVTTSERYAAMDRMSKQGDQQDDMVIYKVVYKEKQRIKFSVSSSGGGGSGSQSENSDEPVTKEVFIIVLLAIGKYSMYVLPSGGAGALDDTYIKSIERDRYGLLAVQKIEYDEKDDTIKLLMRQTNNRPSRQLVFVSTFCESIVQYLRQAIDSIVARSLKTYTLGIPQRLLDVHIRARRSGSTQQLNASEDAQLMQFDLTLQAHCAALNLNKARFNYHIDGPKRAKRFVLLPPNEMEEKPPVYGKYELLAIFRCLQYNPIFQDIILAGHSMQEMEAWMVQKDDGWTNSAAASQQSDAAVLDQSISYNVLGNELYAIVTGSTVLRRIDLTNCRIGYAGAKAPTQQHNRPAPLSALSALATAMFKRSSSRSDEQSSSSTISLTHLHLGRNKLFSPDVQTLVAGIHARKGLCTLDVHDCGLTTPEMEQLLTCLLNQRSEILEYLDISTSTPIAVSPSLIESILKRCKRLAVLRLRGHQTTPVLELLPKCDVHRIALQELDLSCSKIADVAPLCQWMQHPSFNALEVLRLDRCGLHGGQVRSLLIAITQSGNRRLHLSVADNPILRDVVHLPKVFPAFVQGEGPSSLSLAKLEWEDSMLRELFDCLRDNQTLTHLNLSDMSITGSAELSPDTVRMLSSLLERNTVLKELNFSCRPQEDGTKRPCAQLGRALVKGLEGLKRNVALEKLGLAGLDMGDAGAHALSDVLQKNKTLLSIDIDDNKITIEGYRELAATLPHSSIIELPKPRNDLRYQLQSLKSAIAELTQTENETKWFIIHAGSPGDRRRAKTQLQMQTQARSSAELSYKQIGDVIQKMLDAVATNRRMYETQLQRTHSMQMQAQAAAKELAVAQLKRQRGSGSRGSEEGTLISNALLPGATLSAVGGPVRTRVRVSNSSSVRSSRSSSGGDRSSLMVAQLLPRPYDPPTSPLPPSPPSYASDRYGSIGGDEIPDTPFSPASPRTPSSSTTIAGAVEVVGVPLSRFASTSTSSYSRNHPLETIRRQRNMTYPTEQVDHPGFIDDFGIAVNKQQPNRPLATSQTVVNLQTTTFTSSPYHHDDSNNSVQDEEKVLACQELQRWLPVPGDYDDGYYQ